MPKQTRTYAALVDGKAVGKRTTKTMFYTHVTVAFGPDTNDGRPPAVVAFHQSERAARGFCKTYSGYHPTAAACVAPAVLIDKAGNIVAGAP